MKKYTQRELLEEGFWSGLGKGLVKTAKVADKVLTPILPQVTKLAKGPINYGMGIYNAATGHDPKSNDLSDKTIDKMEANLAKQGYTVVDSNDIPDYIGKYNNVPAYSVHVTDSSGNPKTLTVDKNGTIVSTRARSRTRNRNTRRSAQTTTQSSSAGNVVPFTRP